MSLLQIQRLRIAITLQAIDPKLGTDPTLFVPSKRSSRIDLEMGVDPDIAGLYLSGDSGSTVDITTPDRRSEAIDGVVGLLNGFFVRAETEEWHNRTW